MSYENQVKISEQKEVESNSFSIQTIISIGYLILIIIGMYLEFLKYFSFGINIIEHSDFADFLIAPFKNPILIITPVLGSTIFFTFNYYYQKRKIQKELLTEKIELEEQKNKLETQQKLTYQAIIIWIIIMFISINLGAGIGLYAKNYSKIEKKLKSNITNAYINFIDGSTKEVYMYGKNTSNVFYFENHKIDLIVSPVPGNIKSIKYIPKDQQKKIKEED